MFDCLLVCLFVCLLVCVVWNKETPLLLNPLCSQSTSYEHIWDQSLKSSSFIKPASSQPILPLAPSSNSIHSEPELEQMRQKLHELGRDKEMLKAEVALEKEMKVTAHLKVGVACLERWLSGVCLISLNVEGAKAQGGRAEEDEEQVYHF